MKKLLVLVFAVILVLSITACGGQTMEEPVETIKPTSTPKTAVWTITCNESGTSEFESFTYKDFEDLEMFVVDIDGVQCEGYYLFDVFDIMNPNKESMIVSAAVELSGNDVFMFTLVDILNEAEAYMIIKRNGEFCDRPILFANEKIIEEAILNVVILS